MPSMINVFDETFYLSDCFPIDCQHEYDSHFISSIYILSFEIWSWNTKIQYHFFLHKITGLLYKYITVTSGKQRLVSPRCINTFVNDTIRLL